MSRRFVIWMKRFGFWPTWAVFTLVVTAFSVLVSVLLMLLLLGEISRRGVLISVLVPLLMSLTVQRVNFRLLYELDQSKSQMDALTRTDDLTGIFNRRHLLQHLEMELARSLRHGTPFLLFIFDLDDFKEINDTYGHAAGDEALRRVAAAVLAAVRSIDTFARVGGDEFILLVPGAGPEEAPAMAGRLANVVSGLRLEFNGQVCIPHTSIGWAAWRPGVCESEALLKAADDALYRQKAAKNLRRG